jgi:hypothetical protein
MGAEEDALPYLYVYASSGILSALASLLFLAFLIKKLYHNWHGDLIDKYSTLLLLALTVTDLICAISYVIPLQQPEDGSLRCTVEAAFLYWSSLSSILWTSAICFSTYYFIIQGQKVFTSQNQLYQYLKQTLFIFALLCWVLPAIATAALSPTFKETNFWYFILLRFHYFKNKR